jgi:SDR family mycofactocin-dependent oxidoreductase
MGTLDGKVAFITGAARGQGRSHALMMAEAGADIIIMDICGPIETVKSPFPTSEDLQETVRLIEERDRQALAFEGDVRDLARMEEIVREGVAHFGHLDIVSANAGILSAGFLWELSELQWRTMIDINLTGVWNTIKATVPVLVEQGTGGSIILTSSVAGIKGTPFGGHYVAAKHGVVGICRTLANELGPHNIRVNTIHPVGVNTTMLDEPDFQPLIDKYAETLSPIMMNSLPYSLLEPEDVSKIVCWLAGDDTKYMTGAQIPIDFGMLNR